jgi:hypothetical protein
MSGLGEDDPIMGALSRIGVIIEEVNADLLDRLDTAESEALSLGDDLDRAKLVGQRNAGLVKRLRFLVARAEMNSWPDKDTLAQVRGLLHE